MIAIDRNSATFTNGIGSVMCCEVDADTGNEIDFEVEGTRSRSGEWAWRTTTMFEVKFHWRGKPVEVSGCWLKCAEVWTPGIESALEAAFERECEVQEEMRGGTP